MAFNPFSEKGTPLDQQWEPYSKVVTEPFNKDRIDPFTRSRIIAAFGLEWAGWQFYHEYEGHTNDPQIKELLAKIRRTEDQHRSELGFLFDPDSTPLEHAVANEQMEVDFLANLAREEPDDYVKQVLNYLLLDDMDHLYRYSVLLQRVEGKDPAKITHGMTEIKPARPTWQQHLGPSDTLTRAYDAQKVDPLTRLHALTILALQHHSRSFYFHHGHDYRQREVRELNAAVGEIEEQHITQVQSVMDPNATWLEKAVFHEYSCCWYYYSFIQGETDQRIKGIWEEHLRDELNHVQYWSDLLRKHENKEAQKIWPATLPKLVTLKPSKDYIDQILGYQVEIREDGSRFVEKSKLPNDWASYNYQHMVDIQSDPSAHLGQM